MRDFRGSDDSRKQNDTLYEKNVELLDLQIAHWSQFDDELTEAERRKAILDEKRSLLIAHSATCFVDGPDHYACALERVRELEKEAHNHGAFTCQEIGCKHAGVP